MTLVSNNTNHSPFNSSSARNNQAERFLTAFSSPNPKKVTSVQLQSPQSDTFQEREQIGQFDKYRVIMGESFGSTIDVWVNGKKYEGIQIGRNAIKQAIIQKITQLVNNGSFKQVALVYGEKADGSGAHIENNKVAIAAYPESDINEQFRQAKRDGNFSNSTLIGNVKTVYGLEVSLGVAAAARGKNGAFESIIVSCHSDYDGKLYIGNETIHATQLVRHLVKAGTLKKDGTIEFLSCLIAQDFEALRDAARKYNVTIKANNYFSNSLGVCGAGWGTGTYSVEDCQKEGDPNKIYKVPVYPCTLTFTPKGVFDPWGTRVTEIKYRK
jgi:hypothetical protein